MIVKLKAADWSEMSMEYLLPSLSESHQTEENRLEVDNDLASALWTEVRRPLFSITDIQMCTKKDLSMSSYMEENDSLWFCAALQGCVSCRYNPHTGNECWHSGQANMLTCSDVDSCTFFRKNRPFRMVEIMLSRAYIESLLEMYPDIFAESLAGYTHTPLYRTYPRHILLSSETGIALHHLLHYKLAGNAASMYIDAKVREVLSLFLCRTAAAAAPVPCHFSCGEHEKFLHARQIIEQQYLNPPSLHELALMVGTNEYTLKNGFKALFGTTVFGYLFDYRMRLACQYLLDTEKTIQEIAGVVGYEYQSHFATAFKRRYGASPQAYREKTLYPSTPARPFCL